MIRASLDESYLKLLFGDNEKAINEYLDYLMKEEESFQEPLYGDIIYTDRYNEKLEKLESAQASTVKEFLFLHNQIKQVKKKIKKNEKYSKQCRQKDLSIASYINSSKYKKKFLNKNKYRKTLKKIAKSEKKEEKEMVRLGYIKKGDPDKEFKKLMKANKDMENAISDAYTQKHLLS